MCSEFWSSSTKPQLNPNAIKMILHTKDFKKHETKTAVPKFQGKMLVNYVQNTEICVSKILTLSLPKEQPKEIIEEKLIQKDTNEETIW